MGTVLLFHHVQGLTPGVRAAADSLRRRGRTVHMPVATRTPAAAGGLPPDLVYAGFSQRVIPAHDLARNRPGACGALFFHACMPARELGMAIRRAAATTPVHPSDPRPRADAQQARWERYGRCPMSHCVPHGQARGEDHQREEP